MWRKGMGAPGGAGVTFEKLKWGPLAQGAKVSLIKRYGDWFLVDHKGNEGFVHSAFLA
jgi:SH3-like domain-containing protein